MFLRSLAGPSIVALGTWCAAGALTLSGIDEPIARLAVPASFWWLAGAFCLSLLVPAWRRAPLLASPALLAVVPWLPVPMPAVAWMWTGGLAWVPIGLAGIAAACSRPPATASTGLLAARGESPAAFGRHCIPPDGVAPPSNTRGILSRRAWPGGRIAALGATRDFHHGLLGHRRSMLTAGALTVCVGGVVLWALHPRLPDGDEPHYLVIAQSLLNDGDLRIENNHAQRDYATYWGSSLDPHFVQRGQDGEIYSIHAPGVPVLVAPLFALFGLAGAQTTILLLAGATGALIWLTGWLATERRGAAWFAWAAVTGSVTFLVQSVTIFPDGPGATIVAAATALWLCLVRGTRVATSSIVIVSLLLAVLPFLHTRLVVMAVGLGIALLLAMWREGDRSVAERRRRMAAFVVAPAIGAVCWFGYFWIIYGTFNPVIPYGTNAGTSLRYVPGGIAGLLVDQQFGLLAYSPVLLLAGAGWGRSRTRASAPASRLVAPGIIAIVYMAAVAMYWMWWAGGPASPARLVTSVLPLLAVPLAVMWARASAGLRTTATVLLGLSLSISAWTLVVDRGGLAWNDRDAQAAWLVALRTVVDLPRAAPSFFWGLTGGDISSERLFARHVLVWLFAFGASAAALAYVARSGRSSVTRQVACGVWWFPLGLMLAASGGWWLNGVSPVSPARSQLHVLRRAAAGAPVFSVRSLAVGRVDTVEEAIRVTVPRVDLPGAGAAEWAGLAGVPAGRYDVHFSARRPTGGTLTLRLGPNPDPIDTLVLSRQSGQTRPVVLSAGAAELRFYADAEVAAGTRRIDLIPRELTRGAGSPARAVLRAGNARLFLLNDEVYDEGPAFWVRGGRTAEMLVVAGETGETPMRLRAVNGPRANVMTVSTNGRSDVFDLGPGEAREVPVVFDGTRTARLSISTATGFRPSEDGQSGDDRYLGVRVELPQ